MNHPPPADFNRKLRCLRNHFGIPQASVAAHLGITQSAYQKMECKSCMPRFERLQQIAEFYGISVVELLERPVEDMLEQAQRNGRNLPPPRASRALCSLRVRYRAVFTPPTFPPP
ncbi:MAG: helix-turn-helix domain-containing protein [Saprospiraceae bacterium]